MEVGTLKRTELEAAACRAFGKGAKCCVSFSPSMPTNVFGTCSWSACWHDLSRPCRSARSGHTPSESGWNYWPRAPLCRGCGHTGAGDRDARRWARRHRAWDLNDGTEAATTQVLYGPPGSQPRGPEDATLVSGAFQRADTLDGQRLFNVTKLVPEALRWSRRFNGQNELLDHILASEGLMPRLGQLRQVPVVTIYNEDTPTLVGTNPTVTGSFLTTPR